MSAVLAQIGTKLGTSIKSLSSRVTALEQSGGGGGGGGDLPVDSYTESTFDGSGNLTQMTTWASSAKLSLVTIKTFEYVGGALSQIVQTDNSGETILTTTLSYDSSGNFASLTKDYA